MTVDPGEHMPDGWAGGIPDVWGDTYWHVMEDCPKCQDHPLASNGRWKWCDECHIHTKIEGDSSE